MKAILARQPGGPEVLELGQAPDPVAGPGQILVRARATALNGADLLQRRGLYPPPPGASTLLGLETAGDVESVGAGVTRWKPGDRVMALLAGGGYAEKAALPAEQAMPIPAGLSYEQAAAIPETFLTAYLELIRLGGLQRGESVLIHAGASGVGTAAIQIAREAGARILVTAGSREKLERCQALGAEVLIDYRTEDFSARALEATSGRGVDCILDLVGAQYWARNIASLAPGGRLLLVGLPSGAQAEVDLRALMAKRAHVIGSTLRSRSDEDKAGLVRAFSEFALKRFETGKLVPVIDRVFPLSHAADAHAYLESKANFGKVILTI
jgi:putative PIG3 family NAD(P)H quinone oxidoreductase